MAAEQYLFQIGEVLERIRQTQMDKIEQAGRAMANSVAQNRAIHLFGSGHSVIPVLDIFPRYGSFVGFHPILDPRLMWFNIVGPGGARELLWLERTEGYVRRVLLSHHLEARDTLLIFSHGGMNAAPVEMALIGKEVGLTVVAVTSIANRLLNKPTHSSGKSVHDVADIVIDNCAPPEDALIAVDGLANKVAASSTVAMVAIAMSLVAETARQLMLIGNPPRHVFVSPNVREVPFSNNESVFEAYEDFERTL